MNGKYYIGSSSNVPQRLKTHRCKLRGNRHENEYLQAAWNKHGEDAFVFELVEALPEFDTASLIAREQWYLDNTQCLNRKCGYNIAPMANKTILAEESIEKIRKHQTGRKASPETRALLSRIRKGRPTPQCSKPMHLNPKARVVTQHTLDGKLVKMWRCIKEAQLAMSAKSSSCIQGVCAGRHRSAHGFIWKYADR